MIKKDMNDSRAQKSIRFITCFAQKLKFNTSITHKLITNTASEEDGPRFLIILLNSNFPTSLRVPLPPPSGSVYDARFQGQIPKASHLPQRASHHVLNKCWTLEVLKVMHDIFFQLYFREKSQQFVYHWF